MKFWEPDLKKVRRGGGYHVEGFAVLASNEKTVWFSFEGFRETLNIELEDLGKATKVYKFFDELFSEFLLRSTLERTLLRKHPASIMRGGYFHASWMFHLEKLPNLLDTVEKARERRGETPFGRFSEVEME